MCIRDRLFLLYFLLPANLFLYGVNDLYDRDTDPRNPKKGAEEHLLSNGEARIARAGVLGSLLIGIACLAALSAPVEWLLMAGFLFLSYAYSAPPLRFKARPLFDSLSNALYALPAFLGYHQAAGALPAAPVMLAGVLWTASMHLFSAVPDIRADRDAGLSTTATVLGQRGALLLCVGLWAACAGILVWQRILWPWSLLALAYVVVPAWVLLRPAQLRRAYWMFPAINGFAGMLTFFVLGARL